MRSRKSSAAQPRNSAGTAQAAVGSSVMPAAGLLPSGLMFPPFPLTLPPERTTGLGHREVLAKRRLAEKELLVLGCSKKEMASELRRRGLLPGSDADSGGNAKAIAKRDDADYRLVRKDIARITTELAGMKEDAVMVTASSRRLYKLRLEGLLRNAHVILNDSTNVPQLRAAALRTIIEVARLLAAVDGVATEAKISVEITHEVKLRAAVDRMLTRKREREAREKQAALTP